MVDAFEIYSKWHSPTKGVRDSVSTRLCDLRIKVGKENVTSFVSDDGTSHAEVTVPGYYFAEWLAEQWWPLLWEPSKGEGWGDGSGYRARHCLVAAQHGFALPNLWFTPTGENVHIYNRAHRSEYAEAFFNRSSEASIPREQMEKHFAAFIQGAIESLGPDKPSPLTEAWQEIVNTKGVEERFFCSLIGALGLSPYEEHPGIERALDSASGHLSQEQLRDLCSTSTAEELVSAAFTACLAQQALEDAPEIDISDLTKIKAPLDVPVHPAYQTGYRRARTLRDHLGVSDKDTLGANEVFAKLGIDENVASTEVPPKSIGISGALRRKASTGQIALVHSSAAAKRFATARATYLIWTAEGNNESRLITGGSTRDQKASRAFAAELLAPRTFVKTLATGNKIKWSRIMEVAEASVIAPEAIKLQAENAGIHVN